MAGQKERRTKRQRWPGIIGAIGTAAWLVFWIFAVWGDLKAGVVLNTNRLLALNEWGEFFAGVFAPVALLWLVLGYFRQGRAIAQNTEALEAQEEQLRRQVEETAALVEQYRLQAALTTEVLEEERRARAYQVRPDLIIEHASVTDGRPTVRIRNAGPGIARALLVTSAQLIEPLSADVLTTSGYMDITFRELHADSARFAVACVDIHQNAWEFEFLLDRWGGNRRTRADHALRPLAPASPPIRVTSDEAEARVSTTPSARPSLRTASDR